jgi:hypothetical protein
VSLYSLRKNEVSYQGIAFAIPQFLNSFKSVAPSGAGTGPSPQIHL